MDDLKPLLASLMAGAEMDEARSAAAFTHIMAGAADPAAIAALLTLLARRGETVAEITGAARALRAHAAAIAAPPGAIDVCGTGGDASGSFNVSTAVALVVAARGVPVAKHGNRAASSRSGAADVLAALGVNLDAPLPQLEEGLSKDHICFLMAPRHHAAMRHVVPVRKALGFRTIFNLLGPLANPAGTRRQLVGVFDRRWCRPMAEVLGRLGAEAAWVVHGEDGLDELTVTAQSHVAALKDGKIMEFAVTPEDAGLARWRPEDLKGGDAQTNAAALTRLLEGAPGAYRDIVLLNAGAALMVAGVAEGLADGAALAAEAIDAGRARATLAAMVARSRAAAA